MTLGDDTGGSLTLHHITSHYISHRPLTQTKHRNLPRNLTNHSQLLALSLATSRTSRSLWQPGNLSKPLWDPAMHMLEPSRHDPRMSLTSHHITSHNKTSHHTTSHRTTSPTHVPTTSTTSASATCARPRAPSASRGPPWYPPPPRGGSPAPRPTTRRRRRARRARPPPP